LVRSGVSYIKLPSFNVLSSLFARDDDNELRDFATIHPFFQLAHDLFNVGLDLVIRSNWGCQ